MTGITALTVTMLAAVVLARPQVIWPVAVAVALSVALVTFTARTLRSVLPADWMVTGAR